MTFHAINNQGFGLIRPGNTIGDGDPTQPTDDVQVLVSNSEWIDRTIKPLIFRTGPVSPDSPSVLTTYTYKTWPVYIPRSGPVHGRVGLRVQARTIPAFGAGGVVTATFLASDLTTVLGGITHNLLSTTYATYDAVIPQPINADTWGAVRLQVTDAELLWSICYCDLDAQVP